MDWYVYKALFYSAEHANNFLLQVLFTNLHTSYSNFIYVQALSKIHTHTPLDALGSTWDSTYCPGVLQHAEGISQASNNFTSGRRPTITQEHRTATILPEILRECN